MKWRKKDGATVDPIERDVDLAWELFEAQPTHPEIARLASRVLAQQPGRNGTRILLALHLKECGETDEARKLLLQVAGQRDRFFGDVVRKLRDLEQYECNYDEARKWAEIALREDQESWLDVMELGAATAMSGDLEAGWRLLDEGTAMCGRTNAELLPDALVKRAINLLQSWAPPERFIPAAEEAIRADASSEFIGGPLAWSYVHEGRFDEAEELSLRLLRADPMDGVAESVLTLIRKWRAIVDKGEVTLAEIHASGVIDMAWTQMRDQLLGTDIDSSLAALDPVLPAELAAALRPPLDEQGARESAGEREIAAWHDGQEPGTGALWGVEGDFRLMSSAEIDAMDEAIEADPEAWPQWQADEIAEYFSQVMTDDNGGYLIATIDSVVVRRAGVDDVTVAPKLADWFWDRVAAFGGRDPRPLARPEAGPSTEEPVDDVEPTAPPLDPSPEVLAELDRLNAACLAAPSAVEPQVELWKAVSALDRWVFINRGTPEQPRPYALTSPDGPMLAVFSSATRAQVAADSGGLVAEGASVPLLAVPLPAALDWAMSFGQSGVVGVTIDHPQIGAWCPMPNLARLRQMREQP
ncbi:MULTISPECIES: tetratricopeptide repeat protein [unclassified Nocardioides]|uniref:tetratricopeptide repeat protein n=1 Tax=unclassified Nocardioides TaxID=2615069 RepID=UPI000A84276D|nr:MULTISPECIES: tetratricopeptide repeat protein [unclassified Nocardioides]